MLPSPVNLWNSGKPLVGVCHLGVCAYMHAQPHASTQDKESQDSLVENQLRSTNGGQKLHSEPFNSRY